MRSDGYTLQIIYDNLGERKPEMATVPADAKREPFKAPFQTTVGIDPGTRSLFAAAECTFQFYILSRASI